MTNAELKFMELTPNRLKDIKEELEGLRTEVNALTEAVKQIAEILHNGLKEEYTPSWSEAPYDIIYEKIADL